MNSQHHSSISHFPIQSVINSYRIHRITIFSDGIPPNGHAPPQTPGAFKSSTRPSSCKILGLGQCEQSSKAAMKLWMIIQERGTNHRKTIGKRWLNGIQWCLTLWEFNIAMETHLFRLENPL